MVKKDWRTRGRLTRQAKEGQKWYDIAKEHLNIKEKGTFSERAFKQHFHVCPKTCALLWDGIVSNKTYEKPPVLGPHHLLWTLHFLQTYPKHEVGMSFCNVGSFSTYKGWILETLKCIVALKTVSYLFIFAASKYSSKYLINLLFLLANRR